MLKSVKISEEAYRDVKKLSKELKKEEIIEGLYDVKLSTAIGYAIKRTLREMENKKKANELKQELKEWDTLSDEALLNFEKKI